MCLLCHKLQKSEYVADLECKLSHTLTRMFSLYIWISSNLATCKEKKIVRNIIQEIFYVLSMINKKGIYDILVHKSVVSAQISCFLHFKNFHVKIA